MCMDSPPQLMQLSPSSSRPCAEPPHARCQLPLHLELEAALRILDVLRAHTLPCLNVGFRAPEACRRLQARGGYWTTVATDSASREILASKLGEDVPLVGQHGQLPFEDKQFDVVLLALGCLSGDLDADAAMIRECHRVLKVSGCLLLTVEYAKPFGLANLLHHRHRVAGTGGQYSEAALFDLLKTGFDWLGLRTYCRFWVQMVRQWADRRQPETGAAPFLAALYGLARVLDCLTIFARGYLVTAYGRRKGWRLRQPPRLTDGRNLSEAVLQRSRS